MAQRDYTYMLITDSNSELPLSLAKQYSVNYVRMPYVLDDVEYFYDLGENTDFKHFYDIVRQGKLPQTNAYSPQFYYDLWKEYLLEGLDILHISFSSQLSSTYSFILSAAAQLREEFPDRRIETVDTLAISGGMSLLVKDAIEMQSEGASIDDIVKRLEEYIPRACHLFLVDDLKHIFRGGRLSASSAAMGTMLRLKPILSVDAQGYLKPREKVMGRRKAIHTICEILLEHAYKPEEHTLIILHGDCEEEAQYIKDFITSKVTFKDVFLQYVGPVIGTHAGPGTLAVCFYSDER